MHGRGTRLSGSGGGNKGTHSTGQGHPQDQDRELRECLSGEKLRLTLEG